MTKLTHLNVSLQHTHVIVGDLYHDEADFSNVALF